MARAVSLQGMRNQVRWQADVEGQDNRHTDSALSREINRSHQRLRQMLSENGSDLFLTRTAPASMSIGAVDANSAYGEINWPDGAESIHGIDILFNGRVIPLKPLSLDARNDYQWETWSGAGQVGVPAGFHAYSVGAESGASVGAGKIQIVPAPDQAYSYVVWYLPAWTDAVNGTDVFHDVHGCLDWVVWDVVAKVSGRDNDAQNTYTIAVQERERIMKALLSAANREQSAGAICREDTRGRYDAHRYFVEETT